MKPKKIAFLLPNFFTAASIFLGMLSIVKASNSEFEMSAWLIMAATIFDGLDGRIARLTNTMSSFGAEFDSLADIVAFGAAPAMLLYFYIGHDYGRFGFLVTALFVIFGAIRLARFNSASQNKEPSVFIGLPIPAAASAITMGVLFLLDYEFKNLNIIFLIITLIISLLMVSHIRYPSLKKIDVNNAFFYKSLVIFTIIFSIIYVYSIEGIALIILGYILYGPIRAIYYLIKSKRRV
ncbi:MAG: CDP-diacylglycerol--serine O-phosphatidyltransferase [Epsilonproteobacteria bacterium]|nr:CDP-diacylglycerol--serine O-phosphatidyltransferase [Campylobacterota bacterium]